MLETLAASPWAIGAGALLAALIVGRLLAVVVKPTLMWLARRSSWQWDDMLVKATATPIAMLLAIQLLHVALPWITLEPRAGNLIKSTTALLTTALVLWASFRVVDVVVSVMTNRAWAIDRPAARSLLAIGGRIAKVVIVLFSGISVLAHLGVSVASLIAGLGIGGLALALAAQKTVENLFGTLSIGIDQPLREGDFVRVSNFVGTVESIGLRSTRIRTLDRTLVTIPNGQLADQHIESYTVRDRLRLACELGLIYGTTGAQMRAVLNDLEQLLRAHPKIWPDAVVVRFKEFGACSLNIEIMAWFQTSVWSEFQLIRQEVLLGFMEVVEANGTEFAFPTQTIHMATPTPAAPALAAG